VNVPLVLSAMFIGLALYQLATGGTALRYPWRTVSVETHPGIFWTATALQATLGIGFLIYAIAVAQ